MLFFRYSFVFSFFSCFSCFRFFSIVCLSFLQVVSQVGRRHSAISRKRDEHGSFKAESPGGMPTSPPITPATLPGSAIVPVESGKKSTSKKRKESSSPSPSESASASTSDASDSDDDSPIPPSKKARSSTQKVTYQDVERYCATHPIVNPFLPIVPVVHDSSFSSSLIPTSVSSVPSLGSTVAAYSDPTPVPIPAIVRSDCPPPSYTALATTSPKRARAATATATAMSLPIAGSLIVPDHLCSPSAAFRAFDCASISVPTSPPAVISALVPRVQVARAVVADSPMSTNTLSVCVDHVFCVVRFFFLFQLRVVYFLDSFFEFLFISSFLLFAMYSLHDQRQFHCLLR